MPRLSARHVVAGVMCALVGVIGVASMVSAHAELVSTNPAAGAVLTASPGTIELTFDQSVQLVPDAIRLVAGDGTEVALTDVGQTDGKNTISASVPALDPGSYVVAWRAVSADTHPVNGAFVFSVDSTSDTKQGLVAGLLRANNPSQTTQHLLGIGRVGSYLGIATVIGVCFLLGLAAPSLLSSRRAGVVLITAAGVAVASTMLMISAEASLVVGNASTWSTVLNTTAGTSWFLRLGLVTVVLFLAVARRTYTTASRWAVAAGGAVLAVALLAVVAAGGHGITGRWLVVGYLATLVHLVAMSLWVGGLVALALIVPKDQLWPVAARFSPIALVSVVALIVTGTLNVWRQAGSWSALTASNYGTWFFIKIGLVAIVLVVAFLSRHNVRTDTPNPRQLRGTVFIEVVGMLLILAATAGLVSSAPARDVGATAPVSVSVVQGERLAQVVLAPPVTGGTVLHVYLSSLTGTIAADAPTITVTASLPSENIKGLSIPTESAGPGHAISNDADFPIPGEWVIQVDARYGKFDEVTFVTKFTIE